MKLFQKIKDFFCRHEDQSRGHRAEIALMDSVMLLEHDINFTIHVHPYMSDEKIERDAKEQLGMIFADYMFRNNFVEIEKIYNPDPYSLDYEQKYSCKILAENKRFK